MDRMRIERNAHPGFEAFQVTCSKVQIRQICGDERKITGRMWGIPPIIRCEFVPS